MAKVRSCYKLAPTFGSAACGKSWEDGCDGPVNKDMLNPANRRNTFSLFDITQNIIAENIDGICENGFYILNKHCTLQCAGCQGTISNLSQMDQLRNAHSDSCKFANNGTGPSVRNKEASTLQHFKRKKLPNVDLTHEKHLESLDLSNQNIRSSTFYEIDEEKIKQKYANNGLFYLGRGRAQCFYCEKVFKIHNADPDVIISYHAKIDNRCVACVQNTYKSSTHKTVCRSNSNHLTSNRKRSRLSVNKESEHETIPMVAAFEPIQTRNKFTSLTSNEEDEQMNVSLHGGSLLVYENSLDEYITAFEEPRSLDREFENLETRTTSEPSFKNSPHENTSEFFLPLSNASMEQFEQPTSHESLISITGSASNQPPFNFNQLSLPSSQHSGLVQSNALMESVENQFAESMIYQPEEEEDPIIDNPTPPSGVVMVSIRQVAIVSNDQENDHSPPSISNLGEYTPNSTPQSISRQQTSTPSAIENREVIGAVATTPSYLNVAPVGSGQWADFYPCNDPRVTHMANFSARLTTFDFHWPRFSVEAAPTVFANAGFYYLGYGTKVRCFYCFGGIQDWERNDDPWVEHAKYYPTCEYLHAHRGPDFIREVSERFPDIDRPWSTNLPRPPPQRVAVVDPREERLNFREKLENALRSETARKAEELGFNRHAIKKALKTYLSRNTMINNIPDDVDMYLDLLLQFADASSSSEDEEENRSEPEQGTSIQRSVEGAPSFVTPENVSRSLQEIQMEKRCKVCLDKDADIVFLPCGHLCTCKSCAEALTDCPLCRKRITKAIKTYVN